MLKKFDNAAIEKKWQTRWQEEDIYAVDDRNPKQEKEYVLVEWPYPSGNLHIGHWYAFAVPDIYVRFRRMTGRQVIYPIGFDAFGLPAENAAIKHGLDPKVWTESNITHMRDQLLSMGNAFTWNKTTSSTDPEYYKWTQWMFTQFFKKGIAYRGIGLVNWCPGCQTVIANEQVLSDGTCERSGDLIEKREMPQWMLRITDYADRLVDDLDELDWPESIKESQRNWIGRSRGAEIDFVLSSGDSLRVFTTRPDTLYGVSYLVLAPEHRLLNHLHDQVDNWSEVEVYMEGARQKDEIERAAVDKEKTGVKLAGVTGVNPASGEAIPIFVADYVLAGYGTGAIMAVPAHDERDFAFAKKYNLPVVEVIGGEGEVPYTGSGPLINSGEFDGLASDEAKESIVKKVGGRMANTYRLRDWSIGRQRYWGVPIPIVYDLHGQPHVVPKEYLPWLLPTDVDFTPTGEPPLAKSAELKERTEKLFGEGWTPEVETMDTFVDSSWYFLRYIDNSNDKSLSGKEAQADWLPVDLYFGGAEHTTMHLLYSRFWQKALYDLDLVNDAEPYKRRINRGLILGPDGNKMSKSKGNVIDPDKEVERVGSDAVKIYLAFMGPYEGTNYPWDMGGLSGVRRFLERVNGLHEHLTETEAKEVTRCLHKTIAKIHSDVIGFKFNTAVSSLMIFVNQAEKQGLSQSSYEVFLKLLAPFAPHLSEELWETLGHKESIHTQVFPETDSNWLKDEMVTMVVQVNGRKRGTILVPPEADEETVRAAVQADKGLTEQVSESGRVVYVPGRVINFIQ